MRRALDHSRTTPPAEVVLHLAGREAFDFATSRALDALTYDDGGRLRDVTLEEAAEVLPRDPTSLTLRVRWTWWAAALEPAGVVAARQSYAAGYRGPSPRDIDHRVVECEYGQRLTREERAAAADAFACEMARLVSTESLAQRAAIAPRRAMSPKSAGAAKPEHNAPAAAAVVPRRSVR